MDITEIRWDGLDCINLAQDRGKWLAIVNTVKKFRVAQKAGNLSELLASQRQCGRKLFVGESRLLFQPNESYNIQRWRFRMFVKRRLENDVFGSEVRSLNWNRSLQHETGPTARTVTQGARRCFIYRRLEIMQCSASSVGAFPPANRQNCTPLQPKMGVHTSQQRQCYCGRQLLFQQQCRTFRLVHVNTAALQATAGSRIYAKSSFHCGTLI